MLGGLRKLFTGRSQADAGTEKITLAQVLANGWCELWYQPKIELKTMRLVGAEALVRARHPQRGVLSPFAFLPGAAEIRQTQDACAEIKLSVNVPVTALVKLPIATILREERPRAANWPGLIMEVTEDEIIHDLEIANEVAGALRAFNCTLALDDFGAGYSSLARLRQLPFSELKIDRSYVMNCHTDKVSAGLCEVIVQLGQRFGLKTVAEGIEMTHECHKLQAAGCDIGQGYLFAKPMPKNQLIGMMSRRLVERPAADPESATPPNTFAPGAFSRGLGVKG